MALILKYRVEPPDSISHEVFAGLREQVGNVGLNVSVPLNETASVTLEGQFINVEFERVASPPDDRTEEELESGPSSREADRAAGAGGV